MAAAAVVAVLILVGGGALFVKLSAHGSPSAATQPQVSTSTSAPAGSTNASKSRGRARSAKGRLHARASGRWEPVRGGSIERRLSQEVEGSPEVILAGPHQDRQTDRNQDRQTDPNQDQDRHPGTLTDHARTLTHHPHTLTEHNHTRWRSARNGFPDHGAYRHHLIRCG